METEKIVREVNYIIIHNLDAQEAYTDAAGNVENDKLRNAMLDEADRRGGYARELQREIKDLGEDVADDTSMEASWRRIWLDFKGIFTTKDDMTIVEECKKADEEMVIAYDTILQIGEAFLPPRVYNIIKQQRKEIGLTYQALLKFHEVQIEHSVEHSVEK
ncbi:PA2169 family four-helix-bundle protein [Emticicia agri]|uniref:PA2169 family four-helix-bundle protein n=1 Tax=Emticicia agri TaxID=2492393 RepID=A0A4Q5LZX2_9BACT|nr:PA2169 family four-helix-bundle protein [Emticicia agri]RYU95556.1 PA2169 family four-helix-bundle protein [Emticicia agri]